MILKFLPTVALVLILTFLVGFYFGQSKNIAKKTPETIIQKKPEVTITVSKIPTSQIKILEKTTAPSATPIIFKSNPSTGEPTTKPLTQTNALSLSLFSYPGATETSINGSNMSFKSMDSTQTITDWYKAKISDVGMKATSFIVTNTNGNVLNKLVGANSTSKVEIDISKSSSNSFANVYVNLQNSY